MFLPHELRSDIGWAHMTGQEQEEQSWRVRSPSSDPRPPLTHLQGLVNSVVRPDLHVLLLRAEQQRGGAHAGLTVINKIDYQAFGDHLHFQLKWKHIYFGYGVSEDEGTSMHMGVLPPLIFYFLKKVISIKLSICFRLAGVWSRNLCTNGRVPVKGPTFVSNVYLTQLSFITESCEHLHNFWLKAESNIKQPLASSSLSPVRPSSAAGLDTAWKPTGWVWPG